MNLNISIVEDQEVDKMHLYEMLNQWNVLAGHSLHITMYSSGEELFLKNKYQNIHIFFLDIQLESEGKCSAMTGMDIAVKLREENFKGEIIFLTAYKEYVFEGYNVRAFNYLLKPLSIKNFSKCMDALINEYSANCYIFREKEIIMQIPYQNIIAFHSTLHTVTILTTERTYQQRSSLNEVEKHLPSNFIRCHRSCVINMTHIYKISGTSIHLSNKCIQNIGRSYLKSVREKFYVYSIRGNCYLGGDTEWFII